MATSLHEPIKIGVVFAQGVVRPAWFIWHGRRHDVQDVTLRWQTHEGTTPILHLNVTDGATSFELTCNQQTLAWQLVAVETDGCG